MLPIECIEYIVVLLAPRQRFTVATQLRLLFIRNQCLPVLEHASMYAASMKGQCDLLQCWKESNLVLKYYTCIVEPVCGIVWLGGGSWRFDIKDPVKVLAVLDWWNTSGLEFTREYSPTLMSAICANGQTVLLDWWKTSGFPRHYDAAHTMDCANRAALEWWKTSGLELKYSTAVMDRMAMMYTRTSEECIAILEWWKSSGLELRYSELAIHIASRVGNVAILEWWKTSGLELKYTDEMMASLTEKGNICILQWLLDSGWELKYRPDDIIWACEIWAREAGESSDTNAVMHWWKTNGLLPESSE